MKMNKKLLSGIFFIFIILFLCFVSATYTRSNVQWSQHNPTSSQKLDQSVCRQGQDFIIQISPFGCTPAVVRTDLLEENDVPVYCQLGATKINPLIDVQTIDTVSFSGQYPKEVAGIGFHPAKAALGVEGDLNSPVLNNIGYIVILLKKQQNASAIPDYVSGNLTAKIKYNIKKAFGIGNALFYLPEMNDKEFENKKSQYSFWSGKGTLKADAIDSDSAQISVYQNDQRISSMNLQKGKTSDSIYLPGFQCQAGLKLRLEGLENPDTRARLRVNAEVVEVGRGGKFLENKCEVTGLSNRGLLQQVKLKCQEDDRKTTTTTLTIIPKIILNIDGEDKNVGVGDYLYDESNDRKVYLAYIGTKGKVTSSDDLYVYLISTPITKGDKLSDEEISSLSTLIGDLIDAGQTSSGPIDQISDAIKVFAGTANRLARYLDRGETFTRIDADIIPSGRATQMRGRVIYEVDVETKVYGKNVFIIDFADAQDMELPSEAKTVYENAKKDYETIRESFSSETFTKDQSSTFGEEALYKEILLAWNANQKATVVELCKEFKQDYPDSNKIIEECNNALKLSNQDTEDVYVTINNQIKQISFDGIYEPTWDDYGVRVRVISSTGAAQHFDLTKNKIVYLDTKGTDYLQLVSADENSARIRTSLDVYGIMESIVKEFGSDTVQLDMDVPRDLGRGYSFTLTKLNLKKLAKVSVIPNIDNTGTSANFSFKIGIEKRAIDLPPERIKQMIKDLDSDIKQWHSISDSLGSVVEGLKTSCLVTGIALVAKNFVLNAGGAGIARQEVMRGKDGWYEKCADLVDGGTYSSQEQCYNKNADKIDKDVDELSKLIGQQEDNIKQLESGITKQQFLTESVVNTSAFIQRYAPQVNSYVNQSLPDSITDPSGVGKPVEKNSILSILSYQGWKDNQYSMEQLRDIDLYSKVLNDPSASTELKDIAKGELYSTLLDIKTNSEVYQFASSFDEELKNKGLSEIGATDSYGNERSIKGVYGGGTIKGSQLQGGELEGDTIYPAKSITYNSKKYILVLEGSGENYFISRVYDGISLNPVSSDEEGKIKTAFSSFRKIDALSYQNQYKNAKLRYYETEPYKGMPAVVPFDLKNGWYAAMKQTLPVGANIQTYEASGRVSSFYLCNVGANGIEEFQTIGDDICEMINTGTGMPYNVFHGLDEREARSIINKAVQAIKQASNIPESQRKGYVSILGQRIQVGEPAVDVPQFECQDFMSPKECLLLFNLCDPVICPSSRCDLGGAYPVKDVVQSGIIGSIVLCLPNVKEGIIMPVCLTGIQAGIDGFLSIVTSYRDCLNESLETGKMVGICDEIYSIYMCEFFWKQSIPVANLLIPKIMEFIFGQNVRGGGEYLGVASAWDTAGKAVDYFVSYYGANSKTAFLARTTEGVGGEICKLYTSAVVPSGGDLLDKLTEPDSPVQFHGRFDEIALTTATVPPTSHYKVYYHIYAGKDSGAYYQVYLKGTPESSYYQDITQNLMIGSGYIAVGGYASETIDKVAISGYNQMCINVNGQEECGFKEVSTSFAVNYVKDQYLASQVTEMDIKTEAECISGTSSVYSLLNPNVQSAAESIINPAIYKKGIIRICATDNPGYGTDTNRYVGTGVTGGVISGITGEAVNIPETTEEPEEEPPTEEPTEEEILEGLTKNPGVIEGPRWVAVGFCDNEKIKCWLDTESVKDIIKTTTVEGDALDEVTNNYLEVLKNEGGYLSEEQFSSAVQEIEKETDSSKKITLINNIFGKVFWSGEKVRLLYLRGNAYAEIFRVLWSKLPKPEVSIEQQGTSDIFKTGDAGERVLAAARELKGTIVPKGKNINCLVAAGYVYEYAKVGFQCLYSDKKGDKYTLPEYGGRTISICEDQRPDKDHPTWISQCADNPCGKWWVSCGKCSAISKTEKLDKLQPGDLILYVWSASLPNDVSRGEDYDHGAVFIKWTDKANGKALLFDWNGARADGKWGIAEGDVDAKGKRCTEKDFYVNKKGVTIPACAIYREYTLDISDDSHPVYVYQRPYTRVGELSGGTETPSSSVSPDEENKIEVSPIITEKEETIGERIDAEAAKLASQMDYLNLDEFFSKLLNNVGIKMDYKGREIGLLISDIEKNKDFTEVDVNNLKAGDIVILGSVCYTYRNIGIFHSISDKIYFYSKSTRMRAYFFTDRTTTIEINSISLDHLSKIHDNPYIYRAYRYVGDLSDAEKNKVRERWTLDSAISKVSTLRGIFYDGKDNQAFGDQLVFDGILTESECRELRNSGFLGTAPKDMSWLKNILLGKKLSSG